MFRKHLSQFGIMAYGNLVIEEGCGEIIIKTMYDIAQSAVLLEGLKSKSFNIGRMVRGCNMSPILHVFSNQLLDEITKAGIGTTIKTDVICWWSSVC